MKIDFHNHYYPEEYLKYLEKKDPNIELSKDSTGAMTARLFGTTVLFLPPDRRGKIMEQLGVDVQVLSLSAPNVYFAEVKDSCELARIVNDSYAQICQDYPGKILGFASIPLHGGDEAVRELDRAINRLGLHGVVIGSNINGRPLNSPEFIPFFQEADRMRVPILIHPMSPPAAETIYQQESYLIGLVAFPFETTLAATRMVFSGLFERFRNIPLILSHMGGALPYLFERIDYGYRELEACRAHITQAPSEYFKKFYYETALSYHRPSMICGYQSVGADHILLGSDYPFVPPELAEKSISIIEGLGLSSEEKEKVNYKNAQRILKNWNYSI